ncbi:MAG: hypothetical protein GY851_21880 [bacterium]|nr:hypothetical protein [bacterium]
MLRFESLTIPTPDALVFGAASNPVAVTPEITVGAGEVIPEVNYALPHGTEVSEDTLESIVTLYRRMADGVMKRAAELGVAKLVIEIELVFELTTQPEWGERVIRATRESIESYRDKGVHAALRTTVADIRDRTRPPRNRTGHELDLVLESFERCAPLSDILSIESTGGKELSDKALLMCDAGGVAFALGALASRDMEFLWTRVVEISKRHGKIAGGDAACGFANTAMQLARQKMVPAVFAAVVRAMGAARSLVAVECGATGPDKDCAYEGPVLKAIAGIPIAMEGKSAACAHSSHIGNVAMACCDLWSNESVPYAQLFGGFTPEVSLEELWYDCKLMNEATRRGEAAGLRDMLAASDAAASVEALVLTPASSIRIAEAIVSGDGYADRTRRAGLEAASITREALDAGTLDVPPMELPYLDAVQGGLEGLPDSPDGLVGHFAGLYPETFLPEEYGL